VTLSAADRTILAKQVAAAKPADLHLSHINLTDTASTKRALDEIRSFVSKRGDYVLIALRR
jgi:hypothetical protein